MTISAISSANSLAQTNQTSSPLESLQQKVRSHHHHHHGGGAPPQASSASSSTPSDPTTLSSSLTPSSGKVDLKA